MVEGASIKELYMVGFVMGRYKGCAAIMVYGQDRRLGDEGNTIIRMGGWSSLHVKVGMATRSRVRGVVIQFVAFHRV